MLDYLLKMRFGESTPIATQVTTVKCYERYLKGKHESPLAPDVIEKLNEIIVIEELDETVLKAASMALIRPIYNVKFTGKISKDARRTAAFASADYPDKLIKLLHNVAVADTWLSVLAIMVSRMEEKRARVDIRAIFCKYRASNFAPEDAVPFMIDQWSQCFTVEQMKHMTDEATLGCLAQIRETIKTIIMHMTHFTAYGFKRSTGKLIKYF